MPLDELTNLVAERTAPNRPLSRAVWSLVDHWPMTYLPLFGRRLVLTDQLVERGLHRLEIIIERD